MYPQQNRRIFQKIGSGLPDSRKLYISNEGCRALVLKASPFNMIFNEDHSNRYMISLSYDFEVNVKHILTRKMLTFFHVSALTSTNKINLHFLKIAVKKYDLKKRSRIVCRWEGRIFWRTYSFPKGNIAELNTTNFDKSSPLHIPYYL